MNKNFVSPLSIIEEKLKQVWSGCLKFTEPKDNSVSWHIYCHLGKVQYATSAIGQQERLLYLWQLYQIDSDCPQINTITPEYEQIRNWALDAKIVNLDLQILLLQLTQEAFAQVLSLEKASVELINNKILQDTIADFSWHDLRLLEIKKEAKKITEIRTYINSPFSRVYLQQNNTLNFYKSWKNISKNPGIADIANSQKISSLVSLLSNKHSFYFIASQLNINLFKSSECLQPCIQEQIFDLLPWQESKIEIAPQPTITPKINTYSAQTAKPEVSNSEATQLPIIACIDDSKTVQRQVKLTLEAIGYQVIDILDPALALKKLSRQNPVLILMDINMPTINGYDLCSMLRRSHKFQQIPIVMLTGRDGIIDRMRAKFVGSTDYLTKPFEPNILVELVQKLAV